MVELGFQSVSFQSRPREGRVTVNCECTSATMQHYFPKQLTLQNSHEGVSIEQAKYCVKDPEAFPSQPVTGSPVKMQTRIPSSRGQEVRQWLADTRRTMRRNTVIRVEWSGEEKSQLVGK